MAAAEAAFRRATAAHPGAGAAWNNLADTLLRLGRKAEALEAANRAITLGGPEVDTFRQTLDEIRSAP
jgi:cytochrome c-type biogenesis protein CcmH/NrfG